MLFICSKPHLVPDCRPMEYIAHAGGDLFSLFTYKEERPRLRTSLFWCFCLAMSTLPAEWALWVNVRLRHARKLWNSPDKYNCLAILLNTMPQLLRTCLIEPGNPDWILFLASRTGANSTLPYFNVSRTRIYVSLIIIRSFATLIFAKGVCKLNLRFAPQ